MTFNSTLFSSPAVVWLTGISGAGKTTIANEVISLLEPGAGNSILLDGDEVRRGLNSNLGFDETSRTEAVRRLSEVAKLFVDKHFVVVVAAISPLEAHRNFARSCIGRERFVEVHVDASIEVAIRRDPKGLYRRALTGEIRNVSGFDSRYEVPMDPKLKIDTESVGANEAARLILKLLDSLIQRPHR